jgi:hypothetical protein
MCLLPDWQCLVQCDFAADVQPGVRATALLIHEVVWCILLPCALQVPSVLEYANQQPVVNTESASRLHCKAMWPDIRPISGKLCGRPGGMCNLLMAPCAGACRHWVGVV